MVFILYKLYVLLPYTYPTPKLSPHRRRCISTFPQKTHSVWFISILNYGDTENVLINHLLLVIPVSYPCHYTNLCLHKPHKHAHTHTHTHTQKHTYMLVPSTYLLYLIHDWNTLFKIVFKIRIRNERHHTNAKYLNVIFGMKWDTWTCFYEIHTKGYFLLLGFAE